MKNNTETLVREAITMCSYNLFTLILNPQRQATESILVFLSRKGFECESVSCFSHV